ncbi:MAG: DUF4062 domain-containing protein [Armatimonadota bacterium]
MVAVRTRNALLSSAFRDLVEYRDAAYEAIERLVGWHCIRMEDFGSRDMDAKTLSHCVAEHADLLIGILGVRYGSSPPGSDLSYSEIEYRAARDKGVPRLMFRVPEDFPLPANLIEADDRRERQQRFRDMVMRERVCDEAHSPQDLAQKIVEAVHNLRPPEFEQPRADYGLVPGEAPDVTVIGTPHERFDSLEEAIASRAAALDGPTVFAANARAVAAVTVGGADAYWFLRNAKSPEWLPRLQRFISNLINQRDEQALWALGDMLEAVGTQAPDLVIDSGLIEELWQAGTRPARAAALRAIQTTGAWSNDRIRPLLERAPEDLEQLPFQSLVFTVTEYGATSPDALDVALAYMESWAESLAAMDRKVGAAIRRRLGRAVGDLIEAQSDAALDRAVRIIDIDVLAGDESEIEGAILLRTPSRWSDERPAIQVRNLLAEAAQDDALRGQVLDALEQLVVADSRAKRLIALNVAKEMPTHATSVLLRAVERPINFLYPTARWVHYLLRHTFPSLDPDERITVEAAVMALPEQIEDEQADMAKARALFALPADGVSQAVARERERLRGILPDLETGADEPAQQSYQAEYRVGLSDEDATAHEIAELLSRPHELVRWLHEQTAARNGDSSDGWYDPLHLRLERVLTDSPEAIEPVAHALLADASRLPEEFFVSVATATRFEAERMADADGVVRIADALEVLASSTVRDQIAPVLGRQWGRMSREAQAKTVELLRSWADPETEPHPTLEQSDAGLAGWSNAVEYGLNTTRGAVATALVDIARQSEAPAQEVLDALMGLAQDPTPAVRAVLAWYLSNLVGRRDLRQWRLQAAQTLLSDFDPRVMPHTRLLLRHLSGEEIEEFGASVARVMLRSGEGSAAAAGFLAALWRLREPSDLTERLLEEVLTSDFAPARAEAAHVFAHNVADGNEWVASECIRRCQSLVHDPDPQVRRPIVIHIDLGATPSPHVLDLVAEFGRDDDPEVLSDLHTLLLREVADEQKRRVQVVAAICEGILANDNEEAQATLLYDAADMLDRIYNLLRESGHDGLALHLLDRACYHCIPAAAPLIDRYAGELEAPDGA